MKAILIEDNIQAQELIRGLIKRHFQDIELVGAEATVQLGERLILEAKPDLLLLDIQLRDGSVFEILDRIPEQILRRAALVFITAFGTFENIYKAMRYSAIDYLVKPIDESDFKQAIQSAIDRKDQMYLVDQLRTFQDILLQTRNGSVEKMPVFYPKV
ncbi:MAG: response regulator [Saprospiraceae bacterium]|nr:response regulator [Saprospiraceae bacterium]